MMRASRLNLAAWAMEGGAAGLAGRGDLAAATGARLPRPGIDSVQLLGRSAASIDVNVVAKCGAPMADGVVDDAMNRLAESLEVLLGERAPRAGRRDLGLMADFAGVDVADSCDKGIVHQHGLDGFSTRIGLGKESGVNRGRGLYSQAQKISRLLQRGARQKRHSAKSPGVVIDDGLLRAIAGLKINPNVVVFALGMARPEPNGSSHPQMNHDNSSGGQWKKNVAAQALGTLRRDASAKKAFSIASRKLIPKRVGAGFCARNGGSGYARHLPADVFDFWKLWHDNSPMEKE